MDLPARSFDLARPGVAPPLQVTALSSAEYKPIYGKFGQWTQLHDVVDGIHVRLLFLHSVSTDLSCVKLLNW